MKKSFLCEITAAMIFVTVPFVRTVFNSVILNKTQSYFYTLFEWSLVARNTDLATFVISIWRAIFFHNIFDSW